MQKKNRLLALVLAAAMVVTNALPAFADEGDNNPPPIEPVVSETETAPAPEQQPEVIADPEPEPESAPVVNDEPEVIADPEPQPEQQEQPPVEQQPEQQEQPPVEQPEPTPEVSVQPNVYNGGFEEGGSFDGQIPLLVFELTVDGSRLDPISVQIDLSTAAGKPVELSGEAKAKVEELEADGYTLTWYKDAGHSVVLENGLADVLVTNEYTQYVYGAAEKAEPEETAGSDEETEEAEGYAVTYAAMAKGEDEVYTAVGTLVKVLTVEDALALSADDVAKLLPPAEDGAVSYTLAPEPVWYTDEAMTNAAGPETVPAEGLVLYTEAVPADMPMAVDEEYDASNIESLEELEAAIDAGITDITITGTIKVSGKPMISNVTLRQGADITLFEVGSGYLKLQNVTIVPYTPQVTKSLITVKGGAVNMNYVTVNGLKTKADGGVVYADGGSVTFIGGSVTYCNSSADGLVETAVNGVTSIWDGIQITDNRRDANDGNHVLIRQYTNCNLTIKGNTLIARNFYQGNGLIAAWGNSTITMESGSIEDNTFNYKGPHNGYGSPVHLWGGCTFTMTGGQIVNNHTIQTTDKIAFPVEGVGGIEPTSTVTLIGGTIKSDEKWEPVRNTPKVYALVGNGNWTIGPDFNITGNAATVGSATFTNNGTLNGDLDFLTYAGDGIAENYGTITGNVCLITDENGVGQLTNYKDINGTVTTKDNVAVRGIQPPAGYLDAEGNKIDVVAQVTDPETGAVTIHSSLADAVQKAPDGSTVELLKPVSETGITVSGNVTIKAAEGAAITRVDGSTMFNVTGGSLTLDGVTIDGAGISAGNPLIIVGAGAGLTMQNNSRITNVVSTVSGGAIRADGAEGNRSAVNITDSSIDYCKCTGGNGIALYATYTDVVLTGAKIEHNENTTANNETIINLASHCTIELKPGTSISFNKHHGNGVLALQNSSTGSMVDGVVFEGNTYSFENTNTFGTALHVYSSSEFHVYGGSFLNNQCGNSGVLASRTGGKLYIHGGTYSGNKDKWGRETTVNAIDGLVYIDDNVTMPGPVTVVQGQLENHGIITGDVYVYNHTDTMKFDNEGTVTGTAYFNGSNSKCFSGNAPQKGFGGFENSFETRETKWSLTSTDPAQETYVFTNTDGTQLSFKALCNLHGNDSYGMHLADAWENGAIKLTGGDPIYKDGKFYTTAVLDPNFYIQQWYNTNYHSSGQNPNPGKVTHKTSELITLTLIRNEKGEWVYSSRDKDEIHIYCTYNVTWDPANGGATVTKAVDSVTAYEPAPPANPTRAGYNFNGWARSVDPSTGNVTYTAQWSLIPAPSQNTSSGSHAAAEEDTDEDEDEDATVTAPAAPAAPVGLMAPAGAASTGRRPAAATGTAGTQTAAGGAGTADDTGTAGEGVDIEEDDTPLAAGPTIDEAGEPAGEQPEEDVTDIAEDDTPLAAAPAEAARSHNWLPLLLIPVGLCGIFFIILLWRKKREEEEN